VCNRARSSTWIGLITTAGNGESGSGRGTGSGSTDADDTPAISGNLAMTSDLQQTQYPVSAVPAGPYGSSLAPNPGDRADRSLGGQSGI
jgi:hypothetical protein